MGRLSSNIIFGTESDVMRAADDWALVTSHMRFVPCVISWDTMDRLDFTGLNAFRSEEHAVFLAMSDFMLSFFRRNAYEHIDRAGFEMLSLIHPQSLIDPRAILGPNGQVGHAGLIGAHVKCGANLILRTGAAIHEGSVIGNHVSIGESTKIGRNCRIGDCVTLGTNVILGEGAVIGEQSSITKPGYYAATYPSGTFITDEFSAAVIS